MMRTTKHPKTNLPTYGFNGDVGTGIHSTATGLLDVLSGGSNLFQLGVNGVMAPAQFIGTPVAGAAPVQGTAKVGYKTIKQVISIPDNTATDVLTVTVPVPQTATGALMKITFLASLGAGGAVGVYEANRVGEYLVVVSRTQGLAAAAAISSVAEGQTSAVAGAATIAASLSLSSVTGGNSATQTFTVQATIVKGSGSSNNHLCLLLVEVMNAAPAGISLA